MVLSDSNSWLAGLWMASGIRPLTIWLQRISACSILSPLKNDWAASCMVSTNAAWLMVSSLSLENTGVMQSRFRCCRVTSCVLASIKWFTLLGLTVSSTMVASSTYSPRLNLDWFCATDGMITKFLMMINCLNDYWLKNEVSVAWTFIFQMIRITPKWQWVLYTWLF